MAKKTKPKPAGELTTREAVDRLFHPDMADALREATQDVTDPNPEKPRRKPTKGA